MKKIIIVVALNFLILSFFSQNLEWAKSFESSNFDYGYSVTTDASGNVYTTGFFRGPTDFDPTPNTNILSSVGGIDIFVSKFDSFGNLVWAKNMGGTDDDFGYSVSLDNMGNSYITGYFSGTVDFDPNIGTYPLTSNGAEDIFILKLDALGNFVWAKNVGGTLNDQGVSIVVDGTGDVYTTGFFSGTVDFDPGAGISSFNSSGGFDIFISKLNSLGNFVWAKTIDGTSQEMGIFIDLDASGKVYITGRFEGVVDFDPGVGTYPLSSNGGYDIFISKLDALGNFVWAKAYGGNGGDRGLSLSFDVTGNVYVTGSFESSINFDGVSLLTSSGVEDVFISKLNSSGNFVWAKSIGGASNDAGQSIDVGADGNIYVAGIYQLTADFDPGTGTDNHTSTGSYDIFITKFDDSGNLLWAESMGGSNYDFIHSIALDASLNIYTIGNFAGTSDFDPGTGNYSLSAQGGNNIFISKLTTSLTANLIESTNTTYINIYPNPNNGHFIVMSNKKEMNLNLINALGECLQSIQLNHSNNYQLSIDGLTSGMYFIVGQNEQQSIKQKIIISN